MKTKKEIFKEVWIENFGNEINDQLEIALEHDYIFIAMERYHNQHSNIVNECCKANNKDAPVAQRKRQ